MKTKPKTPFFTLLDGASMDDERVRYPFRDMKVGQYFDVPRELDHRVRVRASQHGKKYDHTYRVQRLDDQRVRVKRIA